MSRYTTFENWRQGREDYLSQPKHRHPKYGTPLKEPYKRSKNKKSLVTSRGKVVELREQD